MAGDPMKRPAKRQKRATTPSPPRSFLCRLHPDFHMPADVDIGVGFDGDAYVRRLKDHGVDAVAMFAKCHYGHSYYDTAVGIRHPRLRGDLLRQVTEACRRHGLGCVGYYSVFLDTAALDRHPDWRLRRHPDQETSDASLDRYRPVCVTSPYLEELMLPQCLEVVKGYAVDELLLDTMTWFNPCFCERCRGRFGHDIPRTPDAPRWMEYVHWYNARYAAFFARVTQVLHAAAPHVKVGFNWQSSFRQPEDPPPGTGVLMADLIATERWASPVCRYFAGVGLPYSYMTGRFLHGLGDWTSNTPLSLQTTAATTIANGADFWIIDRQLPDGSLEERSYPAMKGVFGFVQERRPWVEGARHVPETAALFSYDHVVGSNLEFFADTKARKARIEPFEGVSLLCSMHGRHYTAHNATTLRARAGDYRLVILPEVEFLDAATQAALRDYVTNGGRLLITQSPAPAGVDADLMALAGVRFERFSDLAYGYLDGAEPIRVGAPFALVTPLPGAETLCAHVRPLGAGQGGAQFGHGAAPPAGPSGYPAAVRNRVGLGEVIYVAVPAFGEHRRQHNPHLARFMLDLIDRLLPDPRVRVETPALVEMATLRKGDDLIVHIVNHSGREFLAGYFSPVTEYIPEIRGVTCRIRLKKGRPVPEVWHVPSRRRAVVTRERDGIVVRLPSLHLMASLAVPGYFAE